MIAGLIQAASVVRDENGNWWHPGMPEFDEDQGDEWRAWIADQGLATVRRMLESESDSHLAYISYFDLGGADFSAWVDEPPEGDGWFTLAIHDSEDGPIWCWVRRTQA